MVSPFKILSLLLTNNISRFIRVKLQQTLIQIRLMFVQILSEKISDSIQQIGKLLDSIHQFNQRQRKEFLERIQTNKNQLMVLKTHLKQTNALQTQKQYNTIQININNLRNQIDTQSSVLVSKQNRNINQSHYMKDSKKTHQEALRLIAEKDEQVGKLKMAIFQKQELIKINYEELRDYQRDCFTLAQQNKSMKLSIKGLQSDLCCAKEQLMKSENQVNNLKLSLQEQDRQIRSNLEMIDRYYSQIVTANEQIHHFQMLAELSMKKTIMVEENIQRVELEAAFLNQNYLSKSGEIILKNKQIERLQTQCQLLRNKIGGFIEQNSRLRQDLQISQSQMAKLQRIIFDLRRENKEWKEKTEAERKNWSSKLEQIGERSKKKSLEIQQTQNKFLDLYQNHQEVEQINLNLAGQVLTLKQSKQMLQSKLKNIENQLQISQKQNLILGQQKNILSGQINKCITANRQCESTITLLNQKVRSKEQQKSNLSQMISRYQAKFKQLQTQRQRQQQSKLVLQELITQNQTRVIEMEKNMKSYQMKIIDLKRKLLRAKIETVHEIRTIYCE